MYRNLIITAILALVLLAACSTSRKTASKLPKLETSDLLARMPESSQRLETVSGSGKAIVSDPRGTERVTLNFSANRDTSKVLIKNRLGIEAAELLADHDSLLVYNKVDREAQKMALQKAYRTQLNGLASMNIVQLLQWDIPPDEVVSTTPEANSYKLQLQNGLVVHVDPERYHIIQIQAPATYPAAYSEVHLEGYARLKGFHLPRKITIMSSDRRSRVTFLVQSLNVNPELENLEIELPDKITVERL